MAKRGKVKVQKSTIDSSVKMVAKDTYQNLAANLGIGSNNIMQATRYVMTRFTWDYWTLNVLYRNNWIAKAIIDKPANEMMKNGFEIQSQTDPEKIEKIMQVWKRTKTKNKFLDLIKWARLYGGCILVPMIENQPNMEEPLDFDSIMPDSYRGCFLVDRWSGVSPSVEMIDDISDPDFGKPEYYLVSSDSMHKTIKIHHSRLIKMVGRSLPYWEETAEDYWGASELEHVFEELQKRDNTSANIAFLIFLANIRVLKTTGLSQMITLGDQNAVQKVYDAAVRINQLMCNTGVMVMDNEDSLEQHQHNQFSGMNDIYESFMLDISGAAEIPVDKLFGRSPVGFSNGAETLQNYYDSIQEKQETIVHDDLDKLIRIISMSAIGEVPEDLEIVFNPVRRPADIEKADLGYKLWQPISEALAQNVIDKSTALKELKRQSSTTGLWTNITDEMIDKATEEAEEQASEEREANANMQSLLEKLQGGNVNATKPENESIEVANTLPKKVNP